MSSCERYHTQSKLIMNNSDYSFELHTSNFYDEYNWEEDFNPGSQSHQHCRYDIDNKYFILQ